MRRLTTAAVAATALLGAGATAVAVGRRAARTALRSGGPPVGFGGPEAVIISMSPERGTVTLVGPAAGGPGAGPDLPGRYGLVAADGTRDAGRLLGTVGAVVRSEEAGSSGAITVTRRLEADPGSGASLEPADRPGRFPGTRVRFTPAVHAGNPRTALGLPHAALEIPAELGTLPTWFVPGDRDLWVIALHAPGAGREQVLNLLPFLHRHHLPTLVPTLRGDPGAPPAPGGLDRLGTTEWRDADAALRHAARYGARRVVLIGWSAGADMALRTAAESELRDRIAGLVLDSPLLYWPAALRALAGERGVPRPLVRLARGAARGGIGLPPPRPTEPPSRSDGRPLPVLVVHGSRDRVASLPAARELVARSPESVVEHTVPGAGHAAGWNVDPEGYEERLRRFLTPLL
ncbi:hypothetical protein LZF96_19315 [Streptomyces sp. ST2-7A]|nr:hypothetical protein [Streptomyces sp. ST2-7A]